MKHEAQQPPGALEVVLPGDGLVVLVGASGAGKSTFAAQHFRPTRVVSSDALRAMIADDEAAGDATDDAFALLHEIVDLRLQRARLTVVDATNVHAAARRPLVGTAKRHGRSAVAIVLHPPLEACLAGNAARPGRRIPSSAVTAQHRAVGRSVAGLRTEGFASVAVLESREAIARAMVRIVPHEAPRTAAHVSRLRPAESSRRGRHRPARADVR